MMNNKPKFGVSSAENTEEKILKTSTNNSKETNFSNNSAPNQDTATNKPDSSLEKKTSFGTSTVDADGNHANFIVRIFKLQSTKFWVIHYIISIIAFLLIPDISYTQLPATLYFVNLLLYPVTVTILNEIGHYLGKSDKSVWHFITSPEDPSDGVSFVAMIIYWLGRLILFIFKWYFSFLLGILGLIYMNSQSKKMGL